MKSGLLTWWHKIFGKSENKSDVLEFLESADNSYLEALETKDISLLTPYITLEFYRSLHEEWEDRIRVIVGPPRYRIRKWTLVSEDQTGCVYRRKVTYKDINVKGLRLAVGDPLEELWSVSSGDRKVIDIHEYRI